jgi:hypothetical protein
MKKITLILLSALAFLQASAQKLPKTQKISLLAPGNIKIDGKTSEWDDKFQAYNPASRVFYTISNDDQNLYLTARMDGERAAIKALSGGITLTLKQSSEQSKITKNVAITYPAVVAKGGSTYAKDQSIGEILRGSPNRYKNLKGDTANKKDISALITLTNKQITQVYKEIQVAGIEGVDSLISIYNTSGIKAALLFTDKMEYTYELAIPIKLIEANFGMVKKLSYNIKLNAAPTIFVRRPPGSPVGTVDDPELNYQVNPTDFSGEYTLAKR